ncbi:UDP-glycosyltransferase 74G1 [Senna tora]|uniref:Glycosyltransferase n=1 Tax=Senna tora TaxID=362788 RepID=A0A834XKY9_9FABA|nr:UDP-glycosyltransferase 74G1 [Senna tora]
MENQNTNFLAHCLVLAFPAQGHISPALQFSKRLVQKHVKVTLVSTISFFKNLPDKHLISNSNNAPITFETISDGFDEGGFVEAGTYDSYMDHLQACGPPNALWACSEDRGGLGLACGAMFFTQPCAVCAIFFHVHQNLLKLPLTEEEKESGISLPALPLLADSDLPSFLYRYGSYPRFLGWALDQFTNIDRVDWVFANTFYELEQEVVEWMRKIWPLKTIGPTVPSMLMDKRIKDDTNYGISLFNNNDQEACIKWLDDKPKGSVVYVSFGSLATLSENQMEEMGMGLNESECYFLWVVRSSEESKLPKDFTKTMSKKGLLVTWCPQLQVLSHEAVGCFVTHCGWNSTLEALCLGVPMVGVPQWTDQNTNAKFVKDVWKIGITARVDEKGCFTREEVKECVKEIMEGERGKEMKENAMYWKNMARNAVDEGGSSDKNIEEFVARLVLRS